MSMDAGTKRRLILGMASSLVSKLANSVIQLVQIRVFLLYWSKPLYGDWLLLNSIPSFLSFSNVGFGSVAGNEMTMAVARDDYETALRVFQSCWWLICLAMAVTGTVVAGALYILPANKMLAITQISESDTKWIIAYFGLSVLLGQLEQLLQSAYRCIGRYSYGSFVKSCMSLGAFAAMLIPVFLHQGARLVALWFASANIAGTLILGLMVRHDLKWLRFGWQHASMAEIKRLTFPAFAFMGFPMGNALNIQGTQMAVHYAMGPDALVVFSTARTISRFALQMGQLISNSFEPEFSKSFAQSDTGLIRTLHRRAVQMSLILAFGLIAVMMLGGPFVLNHLTHGEVPPSRGLISVLLLVVVVYQFWSTSATIMTATNQHKRLAAIYIGATAVTALVTYLVAKPFGLIAAAASLILSELLMSLYVLPATLRIAQDSFGPFMVSLLDVPPALHPRTLMRRLSRTRP